VRDRAPRAGRTIVDGALREVVEETGFGAADLEAVFETDIVNVFHERAVDGLMVEAVFAARVRPDAEVVLSEEHDDLRWLAPADAHELVPWPAYHRAIEQVEWLVANPEKADRTGCRRPEGYPTDVMNAPAAWSWPSAWPDSSGAIATTVPTRTALSAIAAPMASHRVERSRPTDQPRSQPTSPRTRATSRMPAMASGRPIASGVHGISPAGRPTILENAQAARMVALMAHA
jgi:ADP-ribose pyrophosphatase YjhB (NUDIX family)